MKSFKSKLIPTAVAAVALIGGSLETKAARVTLDGSGFYNMRTQINYLGRGAGQSGRYRNLGADYYHVTTIGTRWITNRSRVSSGSMSFEFWGMPYYGANTGVVMMTRALKPMRGYQSFANLRAKGQAVFLNEYRYPELNLWEYTRAGWRWRDALTFRRPNLL